MTARNRTRRTAVRRRWARGGAWLAGLLLGTAAALTVTAQEAIRMSLAGEAAAEARRRAASTFGYYNLKLGPLAWRFQASAGIQAHDNISYSDDDPRADGILRPQADTAMRWTITEKNSLNINFGLGYLKYLTHAEFDRFYIEPGSELGFDLSVGDFLFNVHDRVTIQTDVGEIPVASNREDYQRLENVAGVTAHWDLNALVLTLGYDHADYLSLNSVLRLADGRSEIVFARGGLALGPESSIGPELGLTTVDYTDARVNDALQYSAGLFYQSQLSSHLGLKLRAGYTYYESQSSGWTMTGPDSGNPYGDVSLSHDPGRLMRHRLSIGHHVRTGLEYGSRTRPLTVTYAHWNPQWLFLHEIHLTTPVSFQFGEEDSRGGERYAYLSAGFSAARMLTAKLSGRVTYRFLRKDSNRRGGDYLADIVSLIFTYRF